MINKDFLAGIAVGAIRCEKCNIDSTGIRWGKDQGIDDFWELTICYQCGHYLADLERAAAMMRSFCECTSVIVSGNSITFVIKEEGGEI